MTTTQNRTAIRNGTHLGFVSLTVSDLERSLDFDTAVIGFSLLQRSDGTAVLGAGGKPLLVLSEDRGAEP